MGGERWFGTDEDLEREKLAPEKPAPSSPQSSPLAGSNSARLALLDVLSAARNEVAEPPPYLANLHARMDAYVDRRVNKLADDIGPIEKIQAAYTALPYDYSGAFEIPMRTWRDFENPESWNLDVTESEPTRFRQGARLAAGYRFMYMTSNDRVVMERDGIGYVMDAALFSWFFGRDFPELYREFEAYPRWAHEHPVLDVIGRIGIEMMSPENVIMSLPFMFAAPLFAEFTALRGVAGAFAAESRMAGAAASAESRVARAAASAEARAVGTSVVEGRVSGGVVAAEGRVSGAATAVEQRMATETPPTVRTPPEAEVPPPSATQRARHRQDPNANPPIINNRVRKPHIATENHYRWSNPAMPRGNYVEAKLDANGTLTAKVRAKGPNRRGGKNLIADVFRHFGDRIKTFHARWVKGTGWERNYSEYIENLKTMPKDEAAWNTWIGKQLGCRSFATRQTDRIPRTSSASTATAHPLGGNYVSSIAIAQRDVGGVLAPFLVGERPRTARCCMRQHHARPQARARCNRSKLLPSSRDAKELHPNNFARSTVSRRSKFQATAPIPTKSARCSANDDIRRCEDAARLGGARRVRLPNRGQSLRRAGPGESAVRGVSDCRIGHRDRGRVSYERSRFLMDS